jgi:transposase InsO family protein
MPRLWPQDPSPEVLFRYHVVSQVLACVRRGGSRCECVRTVAGVDQPCLDGGLRRVAERTVYRWLKAFLERGVAGLRPAERPRIDGSLVLPDEFLEFLAGQKREDPRVSIPEVIARARLLGKLTGDVDRVTAWRAAKRRNVSTRRQGGERERDARRFAYPHRMQMVLCDGKHFRAGATRARRVALFFLDDAHRFGLHVVVGTSESASLFLRGLYEMSARHGLADIYYLDNGPGFIALDTAEAVRRLEALLVLGTAGYPEGHGAIERFNQTANEACLRLLDGRPDVDPDCPALEVRLRHYLAEVYNQRPHEFLSGKTPHERFFQDPRPLRFPESDADLRARFVIHESRLVSPANTVSMGGLDYEVPRGHRGETVTVTRRLLDGTLHVLDQGRLVEIHPVDLEKNARDGRARHAAADEPPAAVLPKSAADLAFDRDLGPIVGEDGGFPMTEKETES